MPLAFPDDSYVNAIVRVLPRPEQERWLLTDAGSVWRHRDGGALEPLKGIESAGGGFGETPPWALVPRGDEVWVANGLDRLHCLARGRVSQVAVAPEALGIERLVLGGDGQLWAADSSTVWTGDGTRFEKVVDLEPVRHAIRALVATRGGVHVVLSGGDHALAPARITRLTGSSSEEFTLAKVTRLADRVGLADDDEAVLWLNSSDGRWPSLVRVELPHPPWTHLTVRSSQDDNREDVCWDAMTRVAREVCAALGGTDITS